MSNILSNINSRYGTKFSNIDDIPPFLLDIENDHNLCLLFSHYSSYKQRTQNKINQSPKKNVNSSNNTHVLSDMALKISNITHITNLIFDDQVKYIFSILENVKVVSGQLPTNDKKIIRINDSVKEIKLALICIILYKFYKISSTSNISSSLFSIAYDPNILFNVIKSYNPANDGNEYQNYVHNHIFNNLTSNGTYNLRLPFQYTYTSITNELYVADYKLKISNS